MIEKRVGAFFGLGQFGVGKKILFLSYVLVIISMTTVGYYGYQHAGAAYRDKALTLAGQGVRDTSRGITESLRAIPRDLSFVSSFYAMKQYLYWQDLDVDYKASDWKNVTLETFRSFLLSKGYYHKLRFINTQGVEQISVRYNKETDSVSTVQPEDLQDKQHRDYFLESMKNGSEEIFLSAMNLNEEHGKIEKPHVPVLRFARPVFGDNDVRYGVAVLNVYADFFLERVGKNVEANRKRYLVSATGEYFYHPQGKAWTHLLGEQSGFQVDFPEIFAKIQEYESGVFTYDQKIIGFERIYPHPYTIDTFWILIEVMDEDVVMQQLQHFILTFILIFFTTILIVFLVTRYVIGGLVDPLLVINRQLRRLSLGQVEHREDIQYSGKDEIGQMMQYTGKMVKYFEDLSCQADRISAGNYTESVAVLSEQDRLGNAVNNMTLMIRENQQKNEDQTWLAQGSEQLDNLLRGEQSLEEMAKKVVVFLSSYVEAAVGAFYLSDDKDSLHLYASYAYKNNNKSLHEFQHGEGIPGQVAVEKKILVLHEVPAQYLQVCSSLGTADPVCLLVAPFLYNNQVKAVIELGTFTHFTDLQISFLQQMEERVGIAVHSAQSRLRVQEMLQITQEQAATLQSQREKLQASNEELEEQTQRLQASEEELQANQDQLVATNEELEEKNTSLNRQKQAIEQVNKELRASRREIERKAEEVSRASRYKSEFLANMSHELRTPLNSLLILTQALESNKQGNLTEEDIEAIKVIRHSGNELLFLINDILDLSKIEAGHMILVQDHIPVADFLAQLKRTFQRQAEQKGLSLFFNLADGVPEHIRSDRKRLEQILNNFLSNAVKFTEQGEVIVSVAPVQPDVVFRRSDLAPEKTLAVSVQDSGIGIPQAKQGIVFEAFRQVDGGTARKYGGTGLGLSIARDLARLLGGEIHLESKEGKGTRFTLYLPVMSESFQEEQGQEQVVSKRTGMTETVLPVELSVEDDRHDLQEKDSIVLVIEHDPDFARLLACQCHDKGLKCLIASNGEEGLRLVEQYLPKAVILDVKVTGCSGWKVLETLKEQTKTRHIPVHIMSSEEVGFEGQRKGAVTALHKPVSRQELEHFFTQLQKTLEQPMRTLLVAVQNMKRRKDIIALMGNKDVTSEEAETGQEVLDKLKNRNYDCLVMGTEFFDMSTCSLLRQLRKENISIPPVIIYTIKKISWQKSMELEQYASSIIIKGVMSEERLLDESSLLLHRRVSDLPEKKQRVIRNLHEDDMIFQGKRILLVDDDMRNIFALAKVLRGKGMETVKAEDGAAALAELAEEKAFDLVLMDIMMPVMDGYEAIETIRKQPQWKELPIIALTAKAMKDDRSRCLAAGANDYLVKPVDVDRLLALLRLWLYR
uniref:response regulator n=1 Tax=Candidatus Electrothrix sp. TaxID=2170559 RepID=UPI00405780AB